MSEPVKKESPLPLVKATDEGLPPRPLAPRSRKVAALPIAMAAAMVLAGGGAGVYAYAAHAEAKAKTERAGCPVRADADESFIVRAVDKVGQFIHPTPAPMMAGEMPIAVPPTAVPASTASNAISPVDPVPLGGAPPAAKLDVPPTPVAVPVQPPMLAGTSSPVQPPPAIPPQPNHPKLGGKPMNTNTIP